ncbi:MAG: hypothetical protein KDB73_08660 [Planctomycetes bacterium]|nr:hypothetical protein [Planctomycetota bacterium]
MPVRRSGEFLVFEQAGAFGGALGIESERVQECLDHFLASDYSRLFISRNFGYVGRDLDFLKQLASKVQSIWAWDLKLDSIDGLYACQGLQSLGLNESNRPGIDFSRLPQLEHLYLGWHGNDRHLADQAALVKLHLSEVNPASRSLGDVELPSRCTGAVKFRATNVTSLKGVGGLQGVRRFELNVGSHLIALDGIEQIGGCLERVVVGQCPRLRDLGALRRLPKLMSATINGNAVSL